MRTFLSAIALVVITIPVAAQDMSEAITKAAGVPEIPAFLPDKYTVPASEPLPIDGVWLISALRKKIRIDQGRAYAVDPWLHMFVLRVLPDMVVMQNMRRTNVGQYAADDLPLMGPAVLTLNGQGNLDVAVQGTFGPVKYGLVRLEAQYPEELGSEITSATGRTVNIPSPVALQRPVMQAAPTYQPQPVYNPSPTPTAPPSGSPIGAGEECVPIGIDPDSGATICAE